MACRASVTRMKRLALTVLATALVLAGCSADPETPAASDATVAAASVAPLPAELVDHGLADLAAPDLIDALDRLPVDQRPQGVMASVRPTELLVAGPGEAEPTAIPIDGDAFYLSFAPWVTGTHECYFHSLTTCQGELGGEEITVTITSADGDVLVDETTTTFANGFVGYWLPRDIEATLEVTYGDLSGTAEIGTGPDDATCVTTLRMLA